MVESLQKAGYQGGQRIKDYHTFLPSWNVMGNPQLARHAINFNDGFGFDTKKDQIVRILGNMYI
ncbi:TPA: hypothetical protein QCR48_004398 [Bacillus cereus]|nr:hypothetical protein [Bacillus cereus]